MDPEKIKQRVVALSDGLKNEHIDFDLIVTKVVQGAYDGNFLNF